MDWTMSPMFDQSIIVTIKRLNLNGTGNAFKLTRMGSIENSADAPR